MLLELGERDELEPGFGVINLGNWAICHFLALWSNLSGKILNSRHLTFTLPCTSHRWLGRDLIVFAVYNFCEGLTVGLYFAFPYDECMGVLIGPPYLPFCPVVDFRCWVRMFMWGSYQSAIGYRTVDGVVENVWDSQLVKEYKSGLHLQKLHFPSLMKDLTY